MSGSFTMSHAKRASKQKSQTKAVTVLGIAGALWLAAGVFLITVGPVADTPTENTAPVITLGEEEISAVSLATFYVIETAGAHRPGLQLVKERRHRGSGGAVYGGSAIAAEVTGVAVDPRVPEGRMVCRHRDGERTQS